MANIKTGFIFYKVDTDRFLDIRIKRLKKDRGCEGYAVYEYLLNEIYRVKGCFLAYDENTAFDAAEYWGLEESQVNDIVNYCCACGLFDKGLFTSAGILTSRSIQSRYIEMSRIAKRASYAIPQQYDLISGVKRDSSGSLTDSSGSLDDYSGSLDDYSVCLPQSKVKERKEKNKPSIIPLSGGDRESFFPEESSSAIHDVCTESAANSEADASAVNSPCSRNRFSTPTLEEVASYCKERQNSVDPQEFIDHYESVGWMVGRNHMKDWKASVRTWENRRKRDQQSCGSAMDYKIPL